jgi:hypothetical protein
MYLFVLSYNIHVSKKPGNDIFTFEHVYFLKRSIHFVFLYRVNFTAACTQFYHLGSRKGDENTMVTVAKALFDSLHSPSGFVL